MPSSSGTHGTFRLNLGSILKVGLDTTSGGRIGRGAYLWKDCRFSRELAKAWVREKRERERSKGNENDGVILYCSCTCSEKSFLNIEDEEYKTEILNIAISSGRDMNSLKEISYIHNLFVKSIEDQYQIKIDIVQGKTPSPGDVFFADDPKYPHKLLGNPFCLAIRNPKCVIIQKYEGFRI